MCPGKEEPNVGNPNDKRPNKRMREKPIYAVNSARLRVMNVTVVVVVYVH